MSDPNVSHLLSKDKCVPIPSQVTPPTSEEQKPSTHGLIGHPALKLSNTIDKLKPPGPDSNYLKWSWILDMHFNTTGVGYIIDPAFPHPKRSPTFSHDNGAVCSVLAQTINPANICSIQQFNKDAQKIWGDNIEAHLDHMSKIFEQLNSLTNPERPLTQENFFATAIFTSLSQDWLPCVSALMKEPFVASSKVTAALKQEGLRWKAWAEDILDTTTVASEKTKPQSTSANQDGMVKRCVFCNADGHNLYTCFNTARILREAKDQRNNGGDGQSDSNQPAKKKGSKPPSKPVAKASQTLVAHLGSSAHNDEEDTDYSGSEIGVVSHQAAEIAWPPLSCAATPTPINDLANQTAPSLVDLPVPPPPSPDNNCPTSPPKDPDPPRGLIAARPKGACKPPHALPRMPHAFRTPTNGVRTAGSVCGPAGQACWPCTPVWRACRPCTPSGQACTAGTPVRPGSRKPLKSRGLREPLGALIRVPSGTLIRVPFGTLIRVPFDTLIRVPFGTLIKIPFGTLIRVLFGTLIRVPFSTLIRVLFGTLIRVPFGTLIRVLFGTLIRVPFGTLIRVPFGTLIRVPFGTLIRVPSGTLIKPLESRGLREPLGALIRVPFGTLIRVPNGTLIRVPNGTLIRVPLGTLIRVPLGTLIRVPLGTTRTLIRVPLGTLIRVPLGTLIRLPLGTLIRVPLGTLIRVPLGTLIRVPNGTLLRVLNGTLIRVPSGTLIRVPSGTLIRVPSGTLIRVPSGTLIRVPSGTLIRVPFGTLIRVPNGTLIRAPRGSRKPLNLRGLREPGRTGVPAVHACPEGVQGLHALQTGVHGQHACPAGPHAKPAVLTPFGGVRTPFGCAAIKPHPPIQPPDKPNNIVLISLPPLPEPPPPTPQDTPAAPSGIASVPRSPSTAQTPSLPPRRQSGRERRAPDRYRSWAKSSKAVKDLDTPKTWQQLLKSPNKTCWLKAANNEFASLLDMNTGGKLTSKPPFSMGVLTNLSISLQTFALPALTGRTRQFKRCSNSRVRPVVGQALSDRSTYRRVGQACPISSWDRLHRTSRDRSDKSVRPVGSCFGWTVPVRPPVEHGCSSTARTAVFDRLMPAVL
ncbi:hypothetical protein PCANC_24708 [Puccinia coronata f. sp. avenae]|uniref:Uncharacterized protein n=1 Tax=Puccinia coronata f. sp. avenae TaxID=200324 RepID=A0A2N5TPN4_9BASI|nr:hypothetical protein PCANC_24708 [Puccinia coronata f. sp. avenae]